MSARSVSIYANDPTDPEGDRLVAGIEKFSQHLIMKGDIHALIHEGRFFSTGVAIESAANNVSAELLIQTPAGAPLHARFSGFTGGNATNALYEGTTFSVAGAAVTPVNRNRRSTNVARGTFTSGPTITDDGTPIFLGYTGGGAGGSAAGGSSASFEEYILAASTTYLARITNTAGNNQPVTLSMDFYDTGLEPYAV